VTRAARRLAAALALTVAAPTLAYLLPVPGILRRMGEKRAALSVESLEVAGTITAEGPVADALARASGLVGTAGRSSFPAVFRMKVPGRCRLELAAPDAPPTLRAFVAARDAKITGAGRLEELPALVALLRSACALLAAPVQGDASDAYAAALGRRGVALTEVSLGRFDGRIAYVVGGRAKDPRPLLFVEKTLFQPLRLVAAEGGALHDVRFLGWGSPTGGEWFPRAVEVWSGDALRLRFTTEKAAPNPKLPETLFP
jgi:hypothetical protein